MTIRKISVLMFIFATLTLVICLAGCEKMLDMMPEDEMTSNEITIGVAVAETGDNAEPYGLPMLRGLELAKEQLNMAGANIVFVREDNMSTLEGSKAAVQSLVDQGVPAIIGVGISTQLKEAFPIAQAAGVIAFSPISSAAGLSGEIGDFVFRAGLATNILIPRGVMQTHEALEYNTAAIIYDSDDAYSTSVKEELTEVLIAAGVTISSTEMYVTAETDFTAQLDAINSDPPDVLFVAALSTDMVKIIIQASDHAITSRLIIPDLTAVEVAGAGNSAENAIAFAGWSELDDSPKNQAFVMSYMDTHGNIPSPWAAQAFASLNILANAIRVSGSTDAAAIRDALATTSDLDTVLGAFSFDPNGEAIYDQIVVLEVKDGTLQILE